MIYPRDIPASLKTDKLVAPFIARLAELSEVNPVVSYFCKLYVIEYILSQQLHALSKEIEEFTMQLLDDTEQAKNDPGDVGHVLDSRQLSANLVFVFAFKLFNGCLEDLGSYDGVSKPQLVQKLRATITFWSLFPLFKQDNVAQPVDFAETSAGQCQSEDEFMKFTKDKIKTLKFQLSRLLKDEIPVKGEEQELDALALSLEGLGPEKGAEIEDGNAPATGKHSDETNTETRGFQRSRGNLGTSENGGFSLPAAPQYQPGAGSAPESEEEAEFKLPGAPRFDPGAGSSSDPSTPKLPGAPKLLPDDDLSHVNKKSSIRVFQPTGAGNDGESEEAPELPKPGLQRSASSNVLHVTKESLPIIVDTTEQVSRIQKHAKFAISALNYEDWDTAEAELVRGLEMLRRIKERAQN
ncbi:DUF605-domain-containing protein [Metschnikowia bicuspidata var. bicuspidata NRRL YB-4993]|uniref:DUF605-domain-containing protein n=1 Tax=Metschnikowia bicuspidata var. bicuspidata NRRL YB-4993 TaxID=869754 RepID=A0A1A0HFK3_9ASCO|nr:DUF605-domain-containing protein [Metschnikowia bicuspidata var. bicuspidata NRRL YB-4993]OBA22781.1 DUF605-domain-containing protein [Metschnikowia bicuspidata var. bicuspidata NRRL YB-4993]